MSTTTTPHRLRPRAGPADTRPRGADDPRRARGAPARAAAADRAPRLRERAALHAQVRRGRRAPRRHPLARRMSRSCRSRRRTTCARPTRSACSPCRWTRSRASTRRRGTTGRPTVVGYTTGDLERWASLVARSLRASGIRPGMKVHNAYGYGLFTGGLGAHAGIEALGATVIPMSGGQTARQVQLIRDFEPDAILCTPSYLLTIADAMEEAGIDPRSTSLKVAVLGAEPWTNEMRARARAAPRHRRARHLRPQRGHGPGRRQRVPRDEGRPAHLGGPLPARGHRRRRPASALPDGEMGELVFTSLTKEAFPVIRYRTRDLTRLLPGHGAARHAPHREDHRPQRRHDHPARREPLPDADRGDRARHRDAHAALHPRAHPHRHAWTT